MLSLRYSDERAVEPGDPQFESAGITLSVPQKRRGRRGHISLAISVASHAFALIAILVAEGAVVWPSPPPSPFTTMRASLEPAPFVVVVPTSQPKASLPKSVAPSNTPKAPPPPSVEASPGVVPPAPPAAPVSEAKVANGNTGRLEPLPFGEPTAIRTHIGVPSGSGHAGDGPFDIPQTRLGTGPSGGSGIDPLDFRDPTRRSGGGTVASVGQFNCVDVADVVLPKVQPLPRPRYPRDAVEHELQGDVEMTVLLGRQGTIAIEDIRGAVPDLQQAAREAAQSIAFTPAMSGGVAVDCRARITVSFKVLSH